MVATAAAGILVCGDLTAAHDGQLSYLLQDCSACIQNILLAASALELGACWLGIHPREERMDAIRRSFALPETIIPVSCVAVGHPAEHKPARTRYTSAYVHRERW
jgi:nitroreductase